MIQMFDFTLTAKNNQARTETFTTPHGTLQTPFFAPVGTPDKFRIKIWDKANNDVVIYDNQFEAADDADPMTALGGGSIIVHKAK